MASLTFGAEGGQWRVANESDGKTDLHKTQTDRKNETCGDTVVDLVMSTKEAKALVRGVSRSGTRLNDDTNPYTVAVHESTDDRFVTLGWFDVDIRTGAVKSTIPEEKLVMVSPELAAKTVAACAARPR